MIKAVIFDVGGVLARPRGGSPKSNQLSKGVHSTMAKEIGMKLDVWVSYQIPIEKKAEVGKISKSQALKEISKFAEISPKKLEKLFVRAYEFNYPVNKSLLKFALGLKKKGYKIAILSDQWHISKEAIIKPFFRKNFHPVIVSCEVGTKKPELPIYNLILKKLKIPAKNCVFIDNLPMNLKPAKKLGMKTILFKDNKQLFKQLTKLGVK